MSRIGNAVIIIPKEATVSVDGKTAVVKGPRGELHLTIPMGIVIHVSGDNLEVTRKHNDKPTRALHGALRAILANMIAGVTRGWTRTLELSGVGYRASVSGANLVLSVGFSHQVTIVPRTGITFTATEGKKPEPYKGKGIRYEGEYVRKKAGKTKAVGGAPGAAK